MISRSNPLADRVLALIPINNLGPRLQDRVLEQGHLLEYKKKKKIFKEGARDSYTFYLLDGEVELQTKGEAPMRMRAGDSNALRALAQLLPRRYTAVALSPVTMFRIDRGLLDHILGNDQVSDETGVVEVEELEDDEGADWMTRLISSELFTRLPHDNIQRFFTELEAVPVSTGDFVVEQGTDGDYLYIVAEGKCAVIRRAAEGGQEHQLAVLKSGDVFGEEALISNTPRNASVKMLSPGFVMRLPKQKFLDLVSNPTLHAVDYEAACEMVQEGAVWIDVRFPDEHKSGAVNNSRNIPLNMLRMEASKLDSSKRYVVYCDSGARSSTGAFLLARIGLDASYLAGGFERVQRSPGVKSEPVKSAGGRPATADRTPATKPQAPADKPRAPAAKPQAPAKATSRETLPASADLRTQFAKLKAERDKANVHVKRAAEALADLKRRYGKQQKALEAEQSKRETLEKDLAAATADSQRQKGMEQSRLTSELEKARKKVNELQRMREQLETKLKSAQQGQEAAVERTSELQVDKVRLEKLKHEREVLSSQLEQAKAEINELRSGNQPGKAGGGAKGGAATLDQIKAARKEAEAKIAKERRALEQEAAAQQDRGKILAKKEQLLEQKRAAAEADHKQREKVLANAEAALSAEKADWKKQIDKAIAEERARLEESYAQYKKDTSAKAEKRAQELAGQLVADARTEFEGKIAGIRAEADARVDQVRAEFKEFAVNANARTEALVAKVGTGPEARTDADGGQARQPVGDNVLPQGSPVPTMEEPDLTIEDTAPPAKVEEFEAKEPVSAAPVLDVQHDGPSGHDFAAVEPSDPVPEIDMEIEAVGQSLEDYLADESAGPLTADDEDVPTLEEAVVEIPDKETASTKPEASAPSAPNLELEGDEEDEPDGKDRVLTPAQIAEIRKKMQQKIKATKKSA